MTARWALAAPNTRRWLDVRGLSAVPAVHSAGPHPRDASRAAFKAGVVRQLRAWGWAPRAGVGDRPSDLRAYTGEGLVALMVTHAHGLPPGAAAGCGPQRAMARPGERIGHLRRPGGGRTCGGPQAVIPAR